MKAFILGAGLGKRMRPLTDRWAKPLLRAGGKRLIEFHLEQLAEANISEVVINTHWKAEQFPEVLGDGDRWHLRIQYSHEPLLLETAGGIKTGLRWMSLAPDESFLVINGDVYCEFVLKNWLDTHLDRMADSQALLNLVPNPDHHPNGDFAFDPQTMKAWLPEDAPNLRTYTYSGIALFKPSFFETVPTGPAPLAPYLRQHIRSHQVSASLCDAYWSDIGTPDRLEQLASRLQA